MSYPSLNFEAFHHGWLIRQDQLLEELISSIGNSTGRQLCEYYEAKSHLCERDVFALFVPTWLSPLEQSFLWITGFKPDIVFRILDRIVTDQTEEQFRNIERLKEEVLAEEELAAELELVQNAAVSTPIIFQLLRRYPGTVVVNGEVAAEDAAFEKLRSCLESLVVRADCLRRKSVVKVVEILSIAHGIHFLAALMMFQLRMRTRGCHGATSGLAE